MAAMAASMPPGTNAAPANPSKMPRASSGWRPSVAVQQSGYIAYQTRPTCSSRPAAAARREHTAAVAATRRRETVHHTGEPEDEAAVKAEAMAIVAQAKKDIKLREEARGETKKASTKDDIQALINKRLAQSFADRPKAPEKPKEAPPAKKEAPKEAPPDPEATTKEAAAIVAAANKDYKQRLADREKAKTATAEVLQAMINAKLNISK